MSYLANDHSPIRIEEWALTWGGKRRREEGGGRRRWWWWWAEAHTRYVRPHPKKKKKK